MLYQIEIRETLSRVIPVQAESIEQAIDLVTKQYNDADIVLDSDDFVMVEIKPLESLRSI